MRVHQWRTDDMQARRGERVEAAVGGGGRRACRTSSSWRWHVLTRQTPEAPGARVMVINRMRTYATVLRVVSMMT